MGIGDVTTAMPPDFERRFGGLRRLYGVQGAQRIFDAHVVVVGIGGVGSWATEALARSGVGRLTLVDLDHVAESNINRQVHALESSLGQGKGEAMRERIAQIHPGCRVDVIEEFVDAGNWPALLSTGVDAPIPRPSALIDACDQVRAKVTLAAWGLREGVPVVCVGAAGGKRMPQALEVADLSLTTHDPLLAKVRYQLRKEHGGRRVGPMGVPCVFSREAVAPPEASCGIDAAVDGSLNCHGYGSVVSVTASFGMAAAGWVLNRLAAEPKKRGALQNGRKSTL